MKYALITGGTKGIGKAIGKSLLKKGYSVILNYSTDDNTARQVLNDLSLKYPERISIIKTDLSSIDNVNNFCIKVTSITSKLDVLILNTGITDRSNFLEIKEEQWEKVINTNVSIPFFLIQRLYRIIPTNGSIIFTGSLMGIYPHSFSISYGVTKAAVHALVKNLVKFLSPYQIRVNAVAPGFIDTEWQQEKSHELRNKIEHKISLKRFGQPIEVANACLFLIQNNYVNGEILVVDGGYNFV
ncbi:SDR family oxidoreductase [uncultured Acetobacteroides sp.]|uniref:SDR family NAD(P)-dependent oxidoreductase n=1 Tax=uncultured Acetobacteroides sp. TaxID=1760811 RepID=UPI0029F48D75|nr:SDR family oxidoreductase [uncultured Acetobacteroides sp.]